MELVINMFIGFLMIYLVGYVLALYLIYLGNIKYREESTVIGLTEAAHLSLLSWLTVIIAIIILIGLDDKYNTFIEKLDEKFKGEKK